MSQLDTICCSFGGELGGDWRPGPVGIFLYICIFSGGDLLLLNVNLLYNIPEVLPGLRILSAPDFYVFVARSVSEFQKIIKKYFSGSKLRFIHSNGRKNTFEWPLAEGRFCDDFPQFFNGGLSIKHGIQKLNCFQNITLHWYVFCS